MADIWNGRIYVANVTDLQFTELFSEDMYVWDLAFDSVEQKLYWLQSLQYAIYKSNVDGSDRTLVFNTRDSSSKYDTAWMAWGAALHHVCTNRREINSEVG